MNEPPRKRPPADVEIAARARAREVRVHRAPEGGKVRFTGDPPPDRTGDSAPEGTGDRAPERWGDRAPERWGDRAPESWTLEQRSNLPPELAEGETYRNVEIHWAAGARAHTHRPSPRGAGPHRPSPN